MIPFTVIGGFLGAGKTTLLNHLLTEWTGERIAVIVNDVGEIPIDTDLIASHDGDTITLTNGCICCSLSDEFAIVLPDLAATDPPWDRIVVEASGISDPGAVAQYGTLPGFRLDGVIVLADVETIRERAVDRHVGPQVRHQLVRADVVVVTKGDLVDEATRRAVHAWLDEVTGGTVVVDADHGRLPAGLLTGPVLGPARRAPSATTGTGDSDPHLVEIVTVATGGPVDRAVLRSWMNDLPNEVLRAKGIVAVEGSGRVEVHVVGRRRRLVPLAARTGTSDRDATGLLVVIGLPGTLDDLRVPSGWHLADRH